MSLDFFFSWNKLQKSPLPGVSEVPRIPRRVKPAPAAHKTKTRRKDDNNKNTNKWIQVLHGGGGGVQQSSATGDKIHGGQVVAQREEAHS